jgi:hypothetical protein
MVFVKAHTFYSIVMLGAYVYHSNGSSKLSISKKIKNFRATSKKVKIGEWPPRRRTR